MSEPLHVIAEAGNNHNGDEATAKRLIDVACESRAHSVKFQLIYPEGLYLPEFPTDDGYEPNPAIAARNAHKLPDRAYRELSAYSRERGIGFSGSVFDLQGLDLLDELDVDYVKVASCDLDNVSFVRAVAERGRRVVLSTGMSTLEEVERTLEAVTATGNQDLVLLHCVSVYPAVLEQMNLPFLERLAGFGFPIGLSDHTPDSRAGLIALGLGARWFEKHFTLDRSQEGFDHAYALEPDELAAYVADLEAGLAALEPAAEKVGEAERTVAERARRSLYAARDIAAGETLEDRDVLVVRPQGELAAADYDRVVGCRAARPLRRYEALAWDVLER